MTSIGRITASGISATNENNFSLVNINADFSLLKVEALAEYQGLGAALSSPRRENAETGPLHRTARKLGVLFEQILPPINELAEAYGKRVSEISASEKLRGTGIARNSPFASHVGFDGTSIYAAATSGHSAIAVHLLACMLARTWSGPEATAIWVELVVERKRDVEKNTDASQIQGIAARIAAQQEISRAELAKFGRRRSLKLITKDCGMLVGLQGSTYASVIDVWTGAMTNLQKLIRGMPQRVSKAALLIGISAWHIYPDLNVVGPTVNVKFDDALVAAGGVLTLGLQSASPGADDGVHWSLSLSHLRFYGKPVEITTRADANDVRITIEDLHIIALGGLLGSWGDEPGDAASGAKWLVALRDCYNRGAPSEMHRRLPSLDLFCRTAERFLAPGSPTQKENEQFLLAYGKRKARRFLWLDEPSNPPPPLFGFLDRSLLARISTEFSNTHDNDEVTVDKLRVLALRCGIGPAEGYISRYKSDCQSDLPIPPKMELMTTIPVRPQACYAANDPRYQHLSCVTAPVARSSSSFRKFRPSNDIVLKPKSASFDRSTPAPSLRLVWPYRHQARKIGAENSRIKALPEDLVFLAGDVTKAALLCTPNCLVTCFREPLPRRRASSPTYAEVTEFLQSSQAIPWKVRGALNVVLEDNISDEVSRTETLDALSVFNHESDMARYKMTRLRRSLAALLYATRLYDVIPGASISIGVVHHVLACSNWASDQYHALQEEMSYKSEWRRKAPENIDQYRPTDFSVIAFFETGTLDIHPIEMSPVMALSSRNSIFVANPLLQDPCEPSARVVRLLGNLGRPGVVMLVPPQVPLICSIDPTSWRLVNHATFDGKAEASFKDTSLHLSFTDYEVPLKVSIGAVDAEATVLETLVSAYDREQWVADLDVLNGSEKSFLCLSTSDCLGEGPYESSLSVLDLAARLQELTSKRLVALDCWEEILDPPEGLGHSTIAIVRAGDNWTARVAAMCVCVQRNLRTQVLPIQTPLCWNCSQSIGSMLNTTDVFIF